MLRTWKIRKYNYREIQYQVKLSPDVTFPWTSSARICIYINIDYINLSEKNSTLKECCKGLCSVLNNMSLSHDLNTDVFLLH